MQPKANLAVVRAELDQGSAGSGQSWIRAELDQGKAGSRRSWIKAKLDYRYCYTVSIVIRVIQKKGPRNFLFRAVYTYPSGFTGDIKILELCTRGSLLLKPLERSELSVI